MTNRDKKIILVDDNETSMIACKGILKPHYMVYPSPSAERMFDLLEHFIPDLILLDVEMPKMNGYEAARKLKDNDAHKDIPIIFMTGRDDPESELFGINLGALDYFRKPFVSELLLRRIEIHLSLIDCRKKLETVTQSVSVSLASVTDLLDKARESNDPVKIKDYVIQANTESKNLLADLASLVS